MTVPLKDKKDGSTEEKIKQAAERVFTRKGYAATRTRDIAEEAGLNLALLNYYFRSKEKLFQLVMQEKVQQLFGIIIPILNDPDTSIEDKTVRLAETYIEMILKNQDLPIFVLSEIRNQPDKFASEMKIGTILRSSVMVKQLAARRPDLNPLHFIVNILGMAIFPFLAQPAILSTTIMDQQQFQGFMRERKALIPLWVKAMLDHE